MTELRLKLPQGLTAETWQDAHSSAGVPGLEHRLDEIRALLRCSHLENLYRNPGQSEMRAIVVRLITAPIAAVAWRVFQNSSIYAAKLYAVLGLG